MESPIKVQPVYEKILEGTRWEHEEFKGFLATIGIHSFEPRIKFMRISELQNLEQMLTEAYELGKGSR